METVITSIAPARLGRPFRWLLGSSWLTNLGDGIRLAAGPLLIEHLTGDVALVGLAWLVGRLPWLLFGLHAGYLADRLDRKRLVVSAHLIRIVVLAVFAASILTEAVNVAMVFVALFALTTTEVLADNTTSTLLPMLVEKDELTLCNSRLTVGYVGLNQLVGPPVGAFLFAVGAWVPWISSALIVSAAIGLITRMELPGNTPSSDESLSPTEQIAEGVRWVAGNPPVRTLAATVFFFNVTFGASFAVLVVLAKERLGLGEVGFGLLFTASAIGGILGSVLYPRAERAVGVVAIMRIGLIIETLTHLVLATTRLAPVAMAMLFCFGIHEAMWGTTSSSIRQALVPTELQGRVGSVYSVGLQAGLIIGAGLGSLLSGAIGVTAPYWYGGIGSAIVLALIWRSLSNIAHAAL